MKWAGHVARMGKKKTECRFFVRKAEETDYWVKQGVKGRMISRWILRK
jgi:hypothetical protein